MILGDLLDTCVVAYLDDILIYSPNDEQHLKDVDKVLSYKSGVLKSLVDRNKFDLRWSCRSKKKPNRVDNLEIAFDKLTNMFETTLQHQLQNNQPDPFLAVLPTQPNIDVKSKTEIKIESKESEVAPSKNAAEADLRKTLRAELVRYDGFRNVVLLDNFLRHIVNLSDLQQVKSA